MEGVASLPKYLTVLLDMKQALDSILSNLDDLIDGKKQIGLMGEIKNKEIKTVNTELKGDNEKIIKLLNPLIKELEKIKEKCHSIYVEDIGPHKSMKM